MKLEFEILRTSKRNDLTVNEGTFEIDWHMNELPQPNDAIDLIGIPSIKKQIEYLEIESICVVSHRMFWTDPTTKKITCRICIYEP